MAVRARPSRRFRSGVSPVPPRVASRGRYLSDFALAYGDALEVVVGLGFDAWQEGASGFSQAQGESLPQRRNPTENDHEGD